MLKPKFKIKICNYLFITAIIFTSVLGGRVIFAQTGDSNLDELNTQKNEKRRQLLIIKEKVTALQKQINEQRAKIATLKNEIELFDLQIAQAEAQINALNTEIEVTNLDIIDTLNKITEAEKQIEKKLKLLEELIREIYEFDQKPPLAIILTQDNFSDALNQIQYTINFQDKNQRLLIELKQLKQELTSKKDLLNNKIQELTLLKEQTETTQTTLQAQKTQQQGLLRDTRGQESRYQQLLAEVSEEEARINREIFELDLSIRQKLGDKTLPPVAGALSWPMEGIFTQGYGNTGFTALGYSFHNGIDIAAPPNTPIYSAGDGVVYDTGYGKAAYGNWVVIKHTLQIEVGLKNIYTLYAHLSKISVGSGQGILKGDLVGLQGNTGNTTRLLYGPERGYHLHFSIFDEEGFSVKEGAYPEIYGPYRIPYGYTYNPMEFLK